MSRAFKTIAVFGVATATLSMPSVAFAQVYVNTSPQQELPAPVYNGGNYQHQDLPPPVFNGGYSQPQDLPSPVYNGGYNQPEQLPLPVYNGSFFPQADLPAPSYNGGYDAPQQFSAPSFNSQYYAVPAGEYGSTVYDPVSGRYLDNTPVDDPIENAFRAAAERIQMEQANHSNDQPQTYYQYVEVQPADRALTFVPNYAPPSPSYYSNAPTLQFSYAPQPQTFASPQQNSFGDYAKACWAGPSGCVDGAVAAYQRYQNATNNSLYQGLNVVKGTLGAATTFVALPEAGAAAAVYGAYSFITNIWGAANSANTLSNRYGRR